MLIPAYGSVGKKHFCSPFKSPTLKERQSRYSWLVQTTHASLENSDRAEVARLVERAKRKLHGPKAHQIKASEDKLRKQEDERLSQLSDASLLSYERKGHLLTPALISREALHNLAKVSLKHDMSCLHKSQA